MNLDIKIIKGFLNEEQADWAWNHFIKTTKWEQDVYNFGGRTVPAPRRTALYGSQDYVYSGMKKTANPLTEPHRRLLTKIEAETGNSFNSILLNLYRNGNDSIGWHSDNEPELGENPIVSSLSLGDERIMAFRHSSGKTIQIPLQNGDYLEMGRSVQPNWKHSIAKCDSTDTRVSLTFRSLV